MNIDRIAVGVDGSPNSLAALTWAADLAAGSGAEVVAVHALGLLEPLGPDGEPVPAASHRDEVRRLLDTEWCAPLERAGVPRRQVLRDGQAVQALLSVAEEEGADLIVVGSRGIGGHPELLLGSTSTQVAQRSRIPVVIIPPA